MTQYKFTVNGTSLTAVLGWNANPTLQTQNITDGFNTADTQNCSYGYDDVVRLTTANCGTAAAQTFSYDPFGNINKSGSPYSFQPTYNSATNRFSSIPGASVSYDGDGNVLTDGSHTYAWDAYGNTISLDTVGLTFDALDRMVEQNRSGSYTEIVYAPAGGKLALMNGQSLVKAFVPLPGQATAVYTSTGLDHYRHSDWLGSARLTSSPSRTVISTTAYAPFGETYAQSGAADLSFTHQNSDTTSGDYDFLFREYSTQGRWASPDPAGLAAVDPSNPQSWNRYAYVLNNPLALVDPLGLDPNDGCTWDPDKQKLTCPPPPPEPTSSLLLLWLQSQSCPAGWNLVPAAFGLPWCVPNRVVGDFVREPKDRDRERGNSSGGSGSRNSNSTYDRCISDFYNSFGGKVVQFLAPTSLIPGWNPGALPNAENWAEAFGTKTVATKVAVAGSNAGKIVDYSLTAGTATTAASELSGVVSSALTVGSKIVPPVAAVATGKDLLAHAGCAVKSVLGFIPTVVP